MPKIQRNRKSRKRIQRNRKSRMRTLRNRKSRMRTLRRGTKQQGGKVYTGTWTGEWKEEGNEGEGSEEEDEGKGQGQGKGPGSGSGEEDEGKGQGKGPGSGEGSGSGQGQGGEDEDEEEAEAARKARAAAKRAAAEDALAPLINKAETSIFGMTSAAIMNIGQTPHDAAKTKVLQKYVANSQNIFETAVDVVQHMWEGGALLTEDSYAELLQQFMKIDHYKDQLLELAGYEKSHPTGGRRSRRRH